MKETGAMELPSRGFALWCDWEGAILRVLQDGMGVAEHVSPGTTLFDMVEPDSAPKAAAFLRQMREHKNVVDWELNVLLAGRVLTLHFAGGAGKCHAIVVGASSRLAAALTCEALAETASDEVKELCSNVNRAMRDAKTNGDWDSELYDEITRVNNEFLTMQRALAKANAELKRSEERLMQEQLHVRELNQRLHRSVIETHHRVKNNLQVVAAMVDIQLTDEESPQNRILHRIIDQVRSLAVIHDLLTKMAREQTETDEFLPANAILEKLVTELRQTAGLEITLHADKILIPSADCTPLALVVNELISNAYKHGRSRAWLYLIDHGTEATLTVADDGPGFPPNFNATTAANTGLDLVEHISRWDLKGTTKYQNRPEGGAEISVTFPLSVQS